MNFTDGEQVSLPLLATKAQKTLLLFFYQAGLYHTNMKKHLKCALLQANLQIWSFS